MKEVRRINLIEDEGAQKKLLKASVVITVLALVGVILAFMASSHLRDTFSITQMIIAGLGTLLSMPLHELIHAAIFKLVGPQGVKIKFGYTKGMFYASAAGTIFTRWRYFAVAVGPFLIITAILALAMVAAPPISPAMLMILAAHATGCAGDLWYAWILLTDSRITHALDTQVGVTFYNSREPGEKTEEEK